MTETPTKALIGEEATPESAKTRNANIKIFISLSGFKENTAFDSKLRAVCYSFLMIEIGFCM
jgi:hypothetical protein